VRELRNAVARYLALGDQMAAGSSTSSPAAQPVAGSSTRPPAPEGEPDIARIAEEVIAEGLPLARARERVIDVFERRYLEAMLARHGGIVTRAAEAAGIARRHFQRLRARPR
jgi:DNA-binding NtrC family response regulator